MEEVVVAEQFSLSTIYMKTCGSILAVTPTFDVVDFSAYEEILESQGELER